MCHVLRVNSCWIINDLQLFPFKFSKNHRAVSNLKWFFLNGCFYLKSMVAKNPQKKKVQNPPVFVFSWERKTRSYEFYSIPLDVKNFKKQNGDIQMENMFLDIKNRHARFVEGQYFISL